MWSWVMVLCRKQPLDVGAALAATARYPNVMLCKHGRQDKLVVRLLDSPFPQCMIVVS